MNKILKIALWIIVAITLAAGAYLAYQYFANPAAKNTSPLGGSASSAGLKEISNGSVFDYWINKVTGTIYYMATDGQIYRVTASTTPESLSSQAVGNLSYLKPSFDGSQILVGFGYPQTPTLAAYNPSTKSWTAMPNGAIAGAWDPASNNRLVYLKDNGATNQLFYFTLADKKSKLIAGFSGKDLDLDWTFADTLYLTQRPSTQVPGSLWSYNLKTGLVQAVAREESGLAVKWNAAENKGLRWSFGQLALIDRNNKTIATIGLKTIPSKCAFIDIKIYCFTPNGQESVNTNDLSDSYLKGATSFIDDVYFVYKDSYKVGASMPAFLYSTGISRDADHLDSWNGKLLFVSRKDQKLYSLSL